LSGGVVIANPIPVQYAMNKSIIDAAIGKAIEESEMKGLKGAELTPYLLARVAEVTGGDSLEANIALVQNNAHVAALIAKEYERIGLEAEA